ncbi:OVARIAN TUMOR DOMAIN-containing deubiquitinating enzyme 6 [Linum grandiflorum]
MTRILVQRGSSSSSSSQSRPGPSSAARPEAQATASSQVLPVSKDEELISDDVQEQIVAGEIVEHGGSSDNKVIKNDDIPECNRGDRNECLNDVVEGTLTDVTLESGDIIKGEMRPLGRSVVEDESSNGVFSPPSTGRAQPPPPPVPPPKLLSASSNPRRFLSGSTDSVRTGSSRRAHAWPVVSARSSRSPTESRPSSPRSHVDNEGYNSADEQNPSYTSSYNDLERERQFEIDIRRSKGLEVKRMLEDGNCLFRAVADQVYGDSEAYDLIRQMCIDYMERERDHFSQFITEGFSSYCKRKRRDKVYGNNVEIQAMSEMYNRPIHIYSYSTEPINIFHGNYNTDTPPVRLSYHHGNHYNSLVDPRRLTVGAGLGFGSLRGRNVDKDQVKAAIKAQQDQQIDNASIFALVAEGRFYSDLELTEKEMERMVMEASRAEYLANDKWKPQLGRKESSTSGAAEPSSSGAYPSGSETKAEGPREQGVREGCLSKSMQMVLSMGFSYLQAIEAYSIFGDDVDSMVCYLLETDSSSRRKKGKATE